MTTNNNLKRKAFFNCGLLLIAIAMLLSSASAQSTNPKPPQPKDETPSKNNVYGVVEQLPVFPGGMNAFVTYLSQNIKYPAADKEKNITGKVITQFIVERDGSLTDIKVIRSPTEAMGKEAVRVLSLSPKWIPGKKNGEIVRARYIIPIDFSLPKQ